MNRIARPALRTVWVLLFGVITDASALEIDNDSTRRLESSLATLKRSTKNEDRIDALHAIAKAERYDLIAPYIEDKVFDVASAAASLCAGANYSDAIPYLWRVLEQHLEVYIGGGAEIQVVRDNLVSVSWRAFVKLSKLPNLNGDVVPTRDELLRLEPVVREKKWERSDLAHFPKKVSTLQPEEAQSMGRWNKVSLIIGIAVAFAGTFVLLLCVRRRAS